MIRLFSWSVYHSADHSGVHTLYVQWWLLLLIVFFLLAVVGKK